MVGRIVFFFLSYNEGPFVLVMNSSDPDPVGHSGLSSQYFWSYFLGFSYPAAILKFKNQKYSLQIMKYRLRDFQSNPLACVLNPVRHIIRGYLVDIILSTIEPLNGLKNRNYYLRQ